MYFMIAIVGLFVHMALFIAHLMDGTVELVQEKMIIEVLGTFVVSWVVAIFLTVFDVLLINLIGLHVYLIVGRMTTYEFLTRQKKQAETVNYMERTHNRIASSGAQTEDKKKQSAKNIIETSKKQLYSSGMKGNQLKQTAVKQTVREESFTEVKKNLFKIQDFSHENSNNKNEQSANQLSYTNLNNVNSEVITIRQKRGEDTEDIKSKYYPNHYIGKKQSIQQENSQADSKRIIMQSQQHSQNINKYSFQNNKKTSINQNIRQKNIASRKNHYTNGHEKTQDITMQLAQKGNQQEEKKSQQQQQQNHQANSQIPYSQKATVKSNEFKDKLQFDMRDEIIQQNVLEVKSVCYANDKSHSEKTIKKESRLKTFVAFTKQEELKQDIPNKQKIQKKLSDMKISMFRNYFEHNRSLKFILNGEQPDAFSPRKIIVKKNHKISQDQEREISLTGGQFQLISKGSESKANEELYFEQNQNEKKFTQ